MCYDVAAGTKSALKYAKHRGDNPEIIHELEKQLDLWLSRATTYHHVNGFAHPYLMVFTNEQPYVPQAFTWGLIPHWINDKASAAAIMNKTLNARAERMFDKPSFREPALHKRCLIYLDAFYEYHHYRGKTYPFHIAMRDESPLIVAGLWDTWVDRETGEVVPTCSIVTTKANEKMAVIHNNPKLDEARMPAILTKEMQDAWLAPCHSEADKTSLLALTKPLPAALFRYYTVRRLKGKLAPGNVPEAEAAFRYDELDEVWDG